MKCTEVLLLLIVASTGLSLMPEPALKRTKLLVDSALLNKGVHLDSSLDEGSSFVLPGGLERRIAGRLSWGLSSWQEFSDPQLSLLTYQQCLIESVRTLSKKMIEASNIEVAPSSKLLCSKYFCRHFHEQGELLAKALFTSGELASTGKCALSSALANSCNPKDAISDASSMNHVNHCVERLLREHAESIDAGMKTFQSISDHHSSLIGGESAYLEKTRDKTALENYGFAAVDMGKRAWVAEGMRWMETYSMDYFKEGLAKKLHLKSTKAAYARERNEPMPAAVADDLSSSLVSNLVTQGSKLKLLDIGSCYDPFRNCASKDSFDVTAVDLWPQSPTVYKCDFLSVEWGPRLTEPVTTVEDGIHNLHQLPESTYDIATISLVLSYLPTSSQRVEMLRCARRSLVKPGCGHSDNAHHKGLLLIMEKDSIFGRSGVKGKENLLREWKESISNIGFELAAYQRMRSKHRFFHVFAFRVDDVPTSLANEPTLLIKQDSEV
jgi:hypothetical protein